MNAIPTPIEGLVVLAFAAGTGPVTVRVALSFVDAAGATGNFAAEAAGQSVEVEAADGLEIRHGDTKDAAATTDPRAFRHEGGDLRPPDVLEHVRVIHGFERPVGKGQGPADIHAEHARPGWHEIDVGPGRVIPVPAAEVDESGSAHDALLSRPTNRKPLYAALSPSGE
jgi:hypothetical protein